MQCTEMLVIVTAALFKQQLMVRSQAPPPASLDVFHRPSGGADSKLGWSSDSEILQVSDWRSFQADE